MFFRNMVVFSLPEPFGLTTTELEEKLTAHPLVAPSGLQSTTEGWVPVYNEMVFGRERFMLIALVVTQKILPSAVIRQEAGKRAEQLETQQGFKPGRKQMREITEAVTAEMLPKAFARTTVTRALIDVAGSRILVEATSSARAEGVISALRATLGSLAAVPLATQHRASTTMTQWLSSGQAGHGFSIDQDCTLEGGALSKPTVRFTHHALDGDAVRASLKEGKQVTRLGLTWRDRLSIVIDDKLVVRRLAFLDIEKNRESDADNDVEAQHEADFALMSGEYVKLIDALTEAFGGLA